jgi:hypothetical protein
MEVCLLFPNLFHRCARPQAAFLQQTPFGGLAFGRNSPLRNILPQPWRKNNLPRLAE